MAQPLRDMAEDVGLISTYEFIYFSASNFVHFNPHALFRTGWGAEHGPFTFSIRNMSGYYQSFSSFYGAVLFIGFQASFGSDHFKVDLETEINRLIELIGYVQRWPEIITFEEMNQNRHRICSFMQWEWPCVKGTRRYPTALSYRKFKG